jgi:hypothetical protein
VVRRKDNILPVAVGKVSYRFSGESFVAYDGSDAKDQTRRGEERPSEEGEHHSSGTRRVVPLGDC